MGYGTDGLTFNTLREGNKARMPHFKNSKGEPAHSKPDGSDWSDSQWLGAVVGELGEYANIRKKIDRGDLTMEDAKTLLAKELADTVTYLDILANQLGIDLGQAIMDKFNLVSRRIGCDIHIDHDGWHHHGPTSPLPGD